ncbi:RidA family protein [Bauldia sp.]|uniref:RidA family protein n=1 Tax=Bauldia sp. TaxID=2575872 RepID=UPI003BA8CDC7
MDAVSRTGGATTGATEQRLARLGIVLPSVPTAIGNFELGVVDGTTLILSGQGPVMEDGFLATGRVGDDVSVGDAYRHAWHTGLVLISAMQTMLGGLDHVQQVLRIFGMVNATPDFRDHPRVVDGCSDLMHQVFETRGRHARCAIGVGSLPGGISVEIEASVAIVPGWEPDP